MSADLRPTGSWPPLRPLLNILNPQEADEDPLAHFISDVHEEDDPTDPSWLSAGIVADESEGPSTTAWLMAAIAKPWEKRSDTRHRLPHDNEEEQGNTHSERCSNHGGADTGLSAHPSPEACPTALVEPTLGRAQELLLPVLRLRPNRARSSPRRAWHRPSAALFTVEEEVETPAMRQESEDACLGTQEKARL